MEMATFDHPPEHSQGTTIARASPGQEHLPQPLSSSCSITHGTQGVLTSRDGGPAVAPREAHTRKR